MKYWGIVFSVLLLVSCSKLEVKNEILPDVEHLFPSTIVSDLTIVNLNIDSTLFAYMEDNPWRNIVAESEFQIISGNHVLFSAKANIELKGTGSLAENFPVKSLGVSLDTVLKTALIKGFDIDKVNPKYKLDELSIFRLRSSGQDFGHTMVRDLAYANFSAKNNLDIELMYGTAVQVFVNQRYYGLMNFRSENNPKGLSEMLSVPISDITVAKVGRSSENFKFDEGNELAAQSLLTALKVDDTKTIRSQIDEANFIDYILYEDYSGNIDWALNIKLYKLGNEPFRFLIYDLDFSGSKPTQPLLNALEFVTSDLGKVYRAFQDKEGFNERLEKRRAELYKLFSVSDFHAIVDELAQNIQDEIPYLVAKHEKPSSILQWKLDLEQLQHNFEVRDAELRKQYKLN